jgi:hypothetical protein
MPIEFLHGRPLSPEKLERMPDKKGRQLMAAQVGEERPQGGQPYRFPGNFYAR